VQITASCGREVTSEVLRRIVLLSIRLNDPEKVLNNVTIILLIILKYRRQQKRKFTGKNCRRAL